VSAGSTVLRILTLCAVLAISVSACAPKSATQKKSKLPTASPDGADSSAAGRAGEKLRRTGSHPRLAMVPPTPGPIYEIIPTVPAVEEFEEVEPEPEPTKVSSEPPTPAPTPSWGSESLEPRIASAAAPNVAAALRMVERGRQLIENGDGDAALDTLERAVAIDPNNAFGYYFLARIYFERRNHAQAIGFANRAAILTDASDSVWVGRTYSLQGTIFEHVARYAEARAAYRRALEANPDNVAARVGLARIGAGETSAP